MIKTLFSTFLLIGSVGLNANKPKENAFNSTYLYNSYCYRDILDISNFDKFEVGETYTIINNQLMNLNKYDRPMVLINDNNGFYFRYIYYMDFYCGSNTGDSKYLYLNLTYQNDIDSAPLYYEEYFGIDSYDLDNLDNYYCVFYFPNIIYQSDINCAIFNAVASHSGNSHVQSVDSYYTFLDNNYAGAFTFMGNMLINNNLASRFIYNNRTATYDSINSTGIISNTFMYNGDFVSSNSILLNGVLIPNVFYNAMSNIGVFSYVYQPNEETFASMIGAVIDAPIEMLTKFFNFELFGMNFYIAFASIVTVLIIAYVIRKLV